MNSAIKTTLYIGAGKSGAEREKQIKTEMAKKRPGVEGVSALMMYAFDLLRDLDPNIEEEAKRAGITPAVLINQAYKTYLKNRKSVATAAA